MCKLLRFFSFVLLMAVWIGVPMSWMASKQDIILAIVFWTADGAVVLCIAAWFAVICTTPVSTGVGAQAATVQEEDVPIDNADSAS